MRHGKKVNHLGRTDAHRKAMLSNMASSLILHKRITTTLAKAKALRTFVEPLITKSKSDTTHSRRVVFSYLQNKDVVSILFREVAEKVANRPGGYTRILKMNNRFGDNAEMALIELVDYNEVFTKGDAKVEKKSTRRRGSGSKAKTKEAVAVEAKEPVVDETKDLVEAEEPEVQTATSEEAETTQEDTTASADETSSDDTNTDEEENKA